MSNRRRRSNTKSDNTNLFKPTDSAFTSSSSLEEFANQGYGVPEVSFKADSQMLVENIDIFEISPDPVQPRRAIPSSIRPLWDGQPQTIPELLLRWHQKVEEERNTSFELIAHLENQEQQTTHSAEAETDIGLLESAFRKIVDLAASIRRDGLTNPITIAQKGRFFAIETGERRWLAYHLLNAVFSENTDEWANIPARVVNAHSIWRQASENNARDDLNAIGKARQLALLLMDIHGLDHFKPIEVFSEEHDFYRQIVSEDKDRVPYGHGETLLNAMGFKNKSTFKRYRDLLQLSSEVWTLADDYDCPESVLRRIVQLPPESQHAGFKKWLDHQKVANGNNSPAKEAKIEKGELRFERFTSRIVPRLLNDFEKFDDTKRRNMIDTLETLLEQMKSQMKG